MQQNSGAIFEKYIDRHNICAKAVNGDKKTVQDFILYGPILSP